MKITQKHTRYQNSSNDITRENFIAEMAGPIVTVTITSKRVFDMRIAPGASLKALVTELAGKGYDVNDANVAISTSHDSADYPNEAFRLNNGDCIHFDTDIADDCISSPCANKGDSTHLDPLHLKLRTLTDEITSIINDITEIIGHVDGNEKNKGHQEANTKNSEQEDYL